MLTTGSRSFQRGTMSLCGYGLFSVKLWGWSNHPGLKPGVWFINSFSALLVASHCNWIFQQHVLEEISCKNVNIKWNSESKSSFHFTLDYEVNIFLSFDIFQLVKSMSGMLISAINLWKLTFSLGKQKIFALANVHYDDKV